MSDIKKDMIRVSFIKTEEKEFVEIEILDIGFNTIYRGTMNLAEYARCVTNGGCNYCAIDRIESKVAR